jgi:hypothetical protein
MRICVTTQQQKHGSTPMVRLPFWNRTITGRKSRLRTKMNRRLKQTLQGGCILLIVTGMVLLAYGIWSPGIEIRDGRYDLGTNGIWIQHGWLGDDSWFQRNDRDKTRFRNPEAVASLEERFSQCGIKYIFPHLCPTTRVGMIQPIHESQTTLFLDHFENFKVLPWVGGVLGVHCFPASPQWREAFCFSIGSLLKRHPRLAGVHINIEPMPSGNKDFLTLLKELRKALPRDKIISVAAYPPPTILQPFRQVHWDEDYYREVSAVVDQMAVMMYDTAVPLSKVYRQLMRSWTKNVLEWTAGAEILLGVPAYDDEGVGYHHPSVENLENALLGINAGLDHFQKLPPNYGGISVYCEWEMDDSEWRFLKDAFNSDHYNINAAS